MNQDDGSVDRALRPRLCDLDFVWMWTYRAAGDEATEIDMKCASGSGP